MERPTADAQSPENAAPHGHLSEEAAELRATAYRLGLKFAEARDVIPLLDPSLVSTVPKKFLEANDIVPLFRKGELVVLATTKPQVDMPGLAAAFAAAGLEPWLVTPSDMRRIRMALSLQVADRAELEALVMGNVEPGRADDLAVLFDSMLLDALQERASDIHLEQYGEHVRVRFRVDGDLHDILHIQLSPIHLKGIVNIVKVRARIDIAERRKPQAGRMSVVLEGRELDLRVQTQPSHFGEHVILRILSDDIGRLKLDELGLPEPLVRTYKRLLNAPAGLILMVGPSGCGKSTTVYAGMQLLAHDSSRKIITVEDPVEYAIEGVQQTQVSAEVGFGYAEAVRSFLRQDPDVIFLGEVRDQPTALEALRASQTGHLVLTTLHAVDTVDAMQRLLDLGMHANSVASEFLAAFSQRLARRVCPNCKERAKPDPAVLSEVFPEGAPHGFRCFMGVGCEKCRGYGTLGRIAVVEYLPTSPVLRQGIWKHLPPDELRLVALQAGLQTMRDHALQLVRDGLIPFNDLPQLLPPERLRPPELGLDAQALHTPSQIRKARRS